MGERAAEGRGGGEAEGRGEGWEREGRGGGEEGGRGGGDKEEEGAIFDDNLSHLLITCDILHSKFTFSTLFFEM